MSEIQIPYFTCLGPVRDFSMTPREFLGWLLTTSQTDLDDPDWEAAHAYLDGLAEQERQLARVTAERDQARASLAAMHRRAQEAESQAERFSHEVTDARARADQLGVKLLQAQADLAALRAAVTKLREAMRDCTIDGLLAAITAEEAAFDDLVALLPPETPP